MYEKCIDLHAKQWLPELLKMQRVELARAYCRYSLDGVVGQDSSYFAAAELDGQFCGFTAGLGYRDFDPTFRAANKRSFSSVRDALGSELLKTVFYAAETVVAEEYRRRGIGERLIESKITSASEKGFAYLTIDTDNDTIVRVYTRILTAPVFQRKLGKQSKMNVYGFKL